jgi:FkbM family methyltransferase
MMRLGSRYGGWMFAPSLIEDGHWAMFCGAGEDVSFDLAFQKITGLKVVIVDPTPRAIAHWSLVQNAFGRDGSTDRALLPGYELDGVCLEEIQFVPFAVWHSSGMLKFWEPENPAHVSHSAANLHGTSTFIEVPALTPADIAARTGNDLSKLGLLKLDIEGAEGVVLDWLLDRKVLVPQILVEFDELVKPSRKSRASVTAMANRLFSFGYELVATDGPANYVFIRRGLIDPE